MPRILERCNKPYGVMTQFSPVEGISQTLKDFVFLCHGVYPAGQAWMPTAKGLLLLR